MSTRKVLVAGATGRLGRDVLRVLGARGVAATRRADGAETVLVGPRGVADQTRLSGLSAVINCAGLARGNPEDMEAANVDFAVALAMQARSAGVPVFVQASSFSVYGQVERIFPESPVNPTSSYGRSKAGAEAAIGAMATRDFHPVAIRLPFMFSATDPGLIGTLIKAIERLHIVPLRARGPTLRSMLTYAGAAETLVAIADQNHPKASILAVADPQPFEMRQFAHKLKAAGMGRLVELPIPGALEDAGHALVPGFVGRILRSNMLTPEANFLSDDKGGWVDDEIDRLLSATIARRKY